MEPLSTILDYFAFLDPIAFSAWRWPFVIFTAVAAAGLLWWIYKRRRDGRPLGSARGFSLVEMSIVLVVVGTVLAATTAGLKPVVDSSRRSETMGKLQRIEMALQAYVIRNGCLPCPANGTLAASSPNGGWSSSSAGFYGPNHGTNAQPCATGLSITGTTCATDQGAGTSIGVVPWNSLSLSESDIVDGYGSRISYAVTSALTIRANESMKRSLPANYPAGNLQVSDNNATVQTSVAAYVLISYGKDRIFAFTTAGGTIANGPGYLAANPQGFNSTSLGTGTTFRQDLPREPQGGTHFDDIVIYNTAPNIIQACGPGSCGNPA